MQWFRDLKIGMKLLVAAFVAVLMFGGVGGLTLKQLGEVFDEANFANVNTVPSLVQLYELTNSANLYYARTLRHILNTDEKAMQGIEDRINAAQIGADKALVEYEKLVSDEKDRKMIEADKATWKKLQEVTAQVLPLSRANKNDEARDMVTKNLVPVVLELEKLLEEHMEYNVELANASSKEALSTYAATRWEVIGSIVVSAVLLFGVLLGISRTITKPIGEFVKVLESAARGDFRTKIVVNSKDEVGQLGIAMQTMQTSMANLIKGLVTGVQTLTKSSTELASLATQMTGSSMDTSNKARTVAAAAEELSVNSASVAAGIEEASANFQIVTDSTQQMSATVGEIAQSSERARKITEEASHEAGQITAKMQELGNAVQEIGKVTESIANISAQTNLLALNATIEAARAGDSGRGFAVVANEVKELALQTAMATEDVKHKITAIQDATNEAVENIRKVTGIIDNVTSVVVTIAASIEEQSAVTQDISSSLGEAALGVKDANQRVAQTTSVTQDIAKEIADVNRSAEDINNASGLVHNRAEELAKLADHLNASVSSFQV